MSWSDGDDYYEPIDYACAPPDFEVDVDDDSVWDFAIFWGPQLDGDTIVASSIELPSGLTLDNEAFTDDEVTVYLSGFAQGRTYCVRSKVTTVGGRVWVKTIRIRTRNDCPC